MIAGYEDALALAYFTLRIQGSMAYRGIKQVVVDEAQDYYPMHYEVLKLLFPKARYTILGDINQTIAKNTDMSLYEQIRSILDRGKSTLVTLDKSFRSTSEIMAFSAKFLPPGQQGQCFSRSGEAPAVCPAANQAMLDELMVREINECREKGYESIGLICKTEKHARSVYERLKDKAAVQLIKSDGKEDLQGNLILPVYLSKGLEYDAVLVCDADRDHYSTDDDRKLLYVACTRALHRLNLFYTGEVSPLL